MALFDQPAQAPEDVAQTASKWDEFFGNPENRAALLQFGLQLMQPIGVGQSKAGAVGQAIGAGAEAAGRVRQEDIAGAEAARKESRAERVTGATETNALANLFRAKRTGAMTEGQAANLAQGETKNFNNWVAKLIDSASFADEKDPLKVLLDSYTAGDATAKQKLLDIYKLNGSTGSSEGGAPSPSGVSGLEDYTNVHIYPKTGRLVGQKNGTWYDLGEPGGGTTTP